MLILSLVFACLQIVCACLCYKVESRTGRALLFLVFGVGAFFLTGCLLSPPLLIQGLLLVLAGWSAIALRANAKQFRYGAIGCTAIVYAIYIGSHLSTLRERIKLRQQYPIVSLRQRLSHEERASGRTELVAMHSYTSDAGAGSTDWTVVPAFETRLAELEYSLERTDLWRYNDRAEALRLIHRDYVTQFIDSPGFGVGRMRRMTTPERYVQIDEPEPVRLVPNEHSDFDATRPGEIGSGARHSQSPDASSGPPGPPSDTQLRYMFELGLVDFVNRRGWGYVQNLDHVAGFQPHRFRRPPLLPAAEQEGHRLNGSAIRSARFSDDLDYEREQLQPDSEWHVVRLELVSLLTHDEPCVYVSDELPQMDRASEYPVRPLNAFERRSLETLRSGEDLVSELATNRLLMLGSLRAAKQCLRCHQVERGELLGALSYVLQRQRAIRSQRQPNENVF